MAKKKDTGDCRMTAPKTAEAIADNPPAVAAPPTPTPAPEPEIASGPRTLSRNDIFGSNDLTRELVRVDEWDGDVYIHNLSGAERDMWENECIQARRKGKIDVRGLKVRLIVRCCKDETGTRIFNDSEVPQLQQRNAKALDRLFQVAQKVSGLSDDDVEELAGN